MSTAVFPKCTRCTGPVSGESIFIAHDVYHPECWRADVDAAVQLTERRIREIVREEIERAGPFARVEVRDVMD